MIWLILLILVSILMLFIFLYPFKIIIFNDDKYIYIKISFIITLKLNIYALLDESNVKELQKQTKSLKLIRKLKFKEVNIYLRGINYNYSISGIYYAILSSILPIIENVLEANNITFNYLIDYNGELYVKFKSVVRAKLNNVIRGFYGI